MPPSPQNFRVLAHPAAIAGAPIHAVPLRKSLLFMLISFLLTYCLKVT
jgi:hypothetical protein